MRPFSEHQIRRCFKNPQDQEPFTNSACSRFKRYRLVALTENPRNPTAFFHSEHGLPAGDNLLADHQGNIFDVIRRVGKSPVLLQSIAMSAASASVEKQNRAPCLLGTFSRHSKPFREVD
jgi:hypothetical protein